MNLTGTKIERMMRNNKAVQMERGSEKNSLPQIHPCHGCSYAKESGCIGYCMKKIMIDKHAYKIEANRKK